MANAKRYIATRHGVRVHLTKSFGSLAAKREELRRRLDTVIREQDAVADEVVRLRILIADLERELASKPDAPSFADRASEKNDSQRKRRPNAPSDAS